jgi:hypothetical protein
MHARHTSLNMETPVSRPFYPQSSRAAARYKFQRLFMRRSDRTMVVVSLTSKSGSVVFKFSTTKNQFNLFLADHFIVLDAFTSVSLLLQPVHVRVE